MVLGNRWGSSLLFLPIGMLGALKELRMSGVGPIVGRIVGRNVEVFPRPRSFGELRFEEFDSVQASRRMLASHNSIRTSNTLAQYSEGRRSFLTIVFGAEIQRGNTHHRQSGRVGLHKLPPSPRSRIMNFSTGVHLPTTRDFRFIKEWRPPLVLNSTFRLLPSIGRAVFWAQRRS